MYKPKLILFLFTIVFFYSCKKKVEDSGCPPENIHLISGFYKQFEFKAPSFWVFKNMTTNSKDSLILIDNPSDFYSIEGFSKSCPVKNKWEIFNLYIHNHLFPYGNIAYNINSQNGLMYINKDGSFGTMQAVFDKNIGDSVVNSDGTWSKLENKYTSLIINNKTYNNVYQMFYYPGISNFKRIWWVPNIGFVKVEFVNQTSMLSEFCELDTANVQLY